MPRLTIILEAEELEALANLAYAELRDPRDQIRLIVRQELIRRGLLSPQPDQGKPPSSNQVIQGG